MAKGTAAVSSAGSQKKKNDKYFSKVIGKALDILGILKESPQPLALNDLTERVALAKSSVFRILHTLEVAGYVHRDGSGRYRLAAQAQPIVPFNLQDRLVEAALPRMKELCREFGETVSVAALFDNHIEVVAVEESPKLIRMGNILGRILPPHASSLGKAITAFQPEEQRERILRSYGIHTFTENTITDERRLREEFERVRREGYSSDREETTRDGYCFGAPILLDPERAVAALSISLPKMRLGDASSRERMIRAVQKAAAEISATLQRR